MSKQLIYTWQHKNTSNQIIGEIKRFIDDKGGKQDIPFYISNGISGFDKGTTEAMKAKGNPLFGIETIKNKNERVIVGEGQKVQAALAGLGYQCITSILGASNARNSDWSVLEGTQEILLFPDNDKFGDNYIKDVVEILNTLDNPPQIKIVRLPNLRAKDDVCNWLKQQPEITDWNELDSLENHPAKNIICARLDEIIANNSHDIPDEWTDHGEPEEIADSVLLPVEPIPSAIIPNPYQEFVVDSAYRMQCAQDFIAVASIVTTSSIVGAGCAIRPKQYDDWSVVPNLWGAIISPPARLKTPALNAPLDLLAHLENEAKKNYEEAKCKIIAEEIVYKHELKNVEDAIHNAIKSKTGIEVDDAKIRYEGLVRKEPKKLIRNRFKTNDSTIEKLGEILSENPRGILVARDELTGLLRTLDKEGHETDRAFYLEAWNGGNSFTQDRIGRGTIDIENACVSILGGIQPDKLEDYLYQTFNGNNDGLMQRFQLAVYPDNAEWQLIDQPPKKEAKQQVLSILKNLKNMDFVKHGAILEEGGKRPFFHFCSSAQILFNNWYVEHQRKTVGEESSIMQEHLSKYPKLMPSLALLFHLIDIADGKYFDEAGVSYEATEKAAAWCDYLESHARRIYGLCTTFEQQAISALAKKIKANKLPTTFTVRDVYRKQWHMLTDKNLVSVACDELVEANWLSKSATPPAFGQKPKTLYSINPKLKIGDKK